MKPGLHLYGGVLVTMQILVGGDPSRRGGQDGAHKQPNMSAKRKLDKYGNECMEDY